MRIHAAAFASIIIIGGCASPEVVAPPPAPESKLIAAAPGDPLKPDDRVLDATAAADKVLGGMIAYAKVRELEVEPLRRTLERFRPELVQHLRAETVTSIWLDVPGKDGLALERFQIGIVYRRGLATYRVNERALDDLANVPKLPPDTRRPEVWFMRKVEKLDPHARPARQLGAAAQKIVLGSLFEAGTIAGDATAWVTPQQVEN